MHRRVSLVVLICAGALAAACASSTKFISSWPNPEAKPSTMQGKKVAALVMVTEDSLRYGAEASLARELTKRGAEAKPAYTIIPKEVTQDEAVAKKFLQEAEVRGVVSMRVVRTDKELNQTPGYWYTGANAPYYGSFWGGYYGWGWGAVYSPGYLRTDTIVSVETLVYDLDQDKLVWGGVSSSTNPDNLDSFIKELVTKAAAEIRKAGLIAQ